MGTNLTPLQFARWRKVGEVGVQTNLSAPPPHLVRGVGCGVGVGAAGAIAATKWGNSRPPHHTSHPIATPILADIIRCLPAWPTFQLHPNQR